MIWVLLGWQFTRIAIRLLEDHVPHRVSEGDASVEELMSAVERFVRTR